MPGARRSIARSPWLVLKHGYGPHRRPGTFADAQGETDKREPLTHSLIQVSQVLVMRNSVFATHHVAWIRTTGGIVWAWRIHTERLDAFFDQPHTSSQSYVSM